MQAFHSSRREQQRVDTLCRIHDAAIELVRDTGFSAATVDAIADRAGVSRRTFFNYFATKEDAVLGAGPPSVAEGAVDGLLDASDPLARAVQIVHDIARSARHVRTRSNDRKALIDAHPDLKLRAQHNAFANQDLLTSTLNEHYSGDDADRAFALALVATSILRFAYRKDPEIIDDPRSPIIVDAIELFRSTFKDLP